MKRKTIGIVFTMSCFILASLFFQACSHFDELQKSSHESTVDGDSHNAGRDCMSCHHDSKNEAYDKWWYIAGTAYDQNLNHARSGGVVELWTQPNRTGSLLYTLKIDASGNFYTQKIINFKGGFYPTIVANNGTISQMSTSITEGSCNSCHGVSTNKMTLN